MKSLILSVFLVFFSFVIGNSQIYKLSHSTTFLKKNNSEEWVEIYSTPIEAKITINRNDNYIFIEGSNKNIYLEIKEIERKDDGSVQYVGIGRDNELFIISYKDYITQIYFRDPNDNAYVIESNVSSISAN